MQLSRAQFQAHPFHLVTPSPWPLLTSFSLLILTMAAAMYFNGVSNGGFLVIIGFITTVSSMALWFRDVVAEGTLLGNHTFAVQKGLNLGVALFIISEVFFFISIFWAYFHSALAPTVELGNAWPPAGIDPLNPFEIPLLNTVLLLSSGASVTYAHHSLIEGNRRGTILGIIITVVLAVIFTALQGLEYHEAPFTIADGAYVNILLCNWIPRYPRYYRYTIHRGSILPNSIIPPNRPPPLRIRGCYSILALR